jgi:hypothetical protein
MRMARPGAGPLQLHGAAPAAAVGRQAVAAPPLAAGRRPKQAPATRRQRTSTSRSTGVAVAAAAASARAGPRAGEGCQLRHRRVRRLPAAVLLLERAPAAPAALNTVAQGAAAVPHLLAPQLPVAAHVGALVAAPLVMILTRATAPQWAAVGPAAAAATLATLTTTTRAAAARRAWMPGCDPSAGHAVCIEQAEYLVFRGTLSGLHCLRNFNADCTAAHIRCHPPAQ